MHELELISASLAWPGFQECVNSWGYPVKILRNDQTGLSLMESYQTAFELSDANILGYVHDDVMVYESGWKDRVLKEFEDESVGMVCFGGAKRHGTRDLYSSPYRLTNLARFEFMSNMRNADAHGSRLVGSCNVSVADGFVLFIRRSILEQVGGWPLGTPIGYFCYDYWLSAIVRRQGLRIRLIGIDCDHISGQSASRTQLKDSHEESHAYFYEHFSDVLPAEVV